MDKKKLLPIIALILAVVSLVSMGLFAPFPILATAVILLALTMII